MPLGTEFPKRHLFYLLFTSSW